MSRVPAPIVAAVHASPWGPIHVAVRGDAIVALAMRSTDDEFTASIERRSRRSVEFGRSDALDAIIRQLDEYAAGRRRDFDVPTALEGLRDWDRAVLEGVRRVPYGRVTSYGRLAALIGRPGAARAVGGAVGRNPIGLLIPCHRVIAGDGSIGGYGGSWFGSREELLTLKAGLLAREGVTLPAERFVA